MSATASEAPRPRVLVIEDDASIAASLVRGLSGAGMEVELCTEGEAAIRTAIRGPFSAIVLDLMLPGRDGFEVLEALRGRSKTPILVLTARSDLDDRLRSFALGAVDFVTKPFWIEEIVARIHARIGDKPTPARKVLRFADVAADLEGRTLSVAGERVELTRNEWSILIYLSERQGRAVARSYLAADVLDAFEAVDERTVDSHVAHLRKKLGARGRAAIATVWGIGYRFEPDAAE